MDTALREPTHVETQRAVLSLVALFVGMFISVKITGRLAVSNVAQGVSLIALMWAFPHALRARDAAWFILGIAGVAVAALSVYNSYGYVIQPQFTAFFAAAALYLLLWYRVVRAVAIHGIAETAIRRSILPVFAYLTLHSLWDIATGLPWTDMGFDDKSHAAVAAGFFAFVTLRFWPYTSKLPISGAFMLLALLTASRLPVLMVPFFVLAFVAEYRRQRSTADTVWKVYMCHTTVIVGVAAAAYVLVTNWDAFHVFTRIGPDAASSAQSSTRSHLLLISYGLQVKFDNVMNVLFGVTPGGFAGTVYQSGIDISELRGGGGRTSLIAGTAPMHSSHTSIFVEFPLPVFALYASTLLWLLTALIRRREYSLALGLSGFTLATMFYSNHNEPFFWAILVILVLAATAPSSGASRSVDKSGRQRAERAARGIDSRVRATVSD